MQLPKILQNEQTAKNVFFFALGMDFGIAVTIGMIRPKAKKVLTMNKLAIELLNWGVKNGIRMPTVQQDHELYEKLSFLGLAQRGMQ